jgi:hypothetical protein
MVVAEDALGDSPVVLLQGLARPGKTALARSLARECSPPGIA